jgi:hypothetical protein
MAWLATLTPEFFGSRPLGIGGQLLPDPEVRHIFSYISLLYEFSPALSAFFTMGLEHFCAVGAEGGEVRV